MLTMSVAMQGVVVLITYALAWKDLSQRCGKAKEGTHIVRALDDRLDMTVDLASSLTQPICDVYTQLS